MFLRTNQLNAHYNVFIVGTGPAGMTVALELAKANKRVLMFETGESDSARSDMPTMVSYGHLPTGWWNRHSVRALGGTSNLWGGWCATLTDRDFDNPAAGVRWPIARADVQPYYGRAAGILDRSASIADFQRDVVPGFRYRPFSVREDAPTRFAAKYADVLDSSPLIHVALGCSVVGFDANDGRSSVRTIRGFHHPTESAFSLQLTPAQMVVVACGGIGNAQLLQQPQLDGGVPVGNESGLVGRFLMEHPHYLEAAEVVLDHDLDGSPRPEGFGNYVHALVADDALMLEHGLLACSIACQDQKTDHDIARYLTREQGRTFYHYMCTLRSEMRPSANNRVVLTGDRDRAGAYIPIVRCVFGAEDFLNAETTLRLLGELLIRQRRGRVRITNEHIYRDYTAGGHIMGTTRMGASRSSSVADRDCRVHGYANLFVAGSSLFPTCGYANPTLTIVALSLRLADTLKQG